MSSNGSEYYVQELKTRRGEGEEFLEAHHRMPDGKLIAVVQVCLRCGKKFAPERGRKWCPRCRGLLAIRTMVLKLP